MADEVDTTNDRMIAETSLFVSEVCRKAKLMPTGKPGECFYCGEVFARVVEVIDKDRGDVVDSCGRCRDKRGIA